MHNKRISIIIPYHNNIEYLVKLLDSIKYFDEIEVIVVDDFSDKNLDKYNDVKNNIKYKEVIFLENKSNNRGAGVGRNIGLERASGEWILFADSDDYFVEDYFDKIKKYINSDYDVVFFTPTSIDLDTNKLADRHIFFKNEIEDYIANPSKLNEYQIRYYFYTPWSKMIKRKLVKKYNIRFHEVTAKNDSLFSVKVGHYMKSFKVSKEVIYCATWHSRGNITRRKDENFVIDGTKSRIKLLKFLKDNLSESDLKTIRYNNIAYYFIESLEDNDIDKAYIDKSKSMFNNDDFSVYNQSNILPRLKKKVKKLLGIKNG